MTDEQQSGPVYTTEAQTEELDPRVSTPDDGFPSYDEVDSEVGQAEVDETEGEDAYDVAADLDGEH